MKILDTFWFSQLGNPAQIGIVIGKNDNDEIKCYIGSSDIGEEVADQENIAETGAKFPLDASKVLFPNIFAE